MENISRRKRIYSGVLASLLTLQLTACGNADMLDTVKNYNVAVETTDDTVSMFIIDKYYDYEGEQFQLVTQDGLVILTSSKNTELLRVSDYDLAEDYAEAIAFDGKDIISYDELQGLSTRVAIKSWNKGVLDMQYTFNKAIIQNDGGVTIVNIKQWGTYAEDDKVQLILPDDTVLLRNIEDVKLVNDTNADENALTNYVLSLVGDLTKVTYYPVAKSLSKTQE